MKICFIGKFEELQLTYKISVVIGTSRSSWSCYFFPETSEECRDRAFQLMEEKEAWGNGTITGKENYTSKEVWAGRIPRQAVAHLSNEFFNNLSI